MSSSSEVSTISGRGRRKQAKPQRKNVDSESDELVAGGEARGASVSSDELEEGSNSLIIDEDADTNISNDVNSPDTNHNTTPKPPALNGRTTADDTDDVNDGDDEDDVEEDSDHQQNIMEAYERLESFKLKVLNGIEEAESNIILNNLNVRTGGPHDKKLKELLERPYAALNLNSPAKSPAPSSSPNPVTKDADANLENSNSVPSLESSLGLVKFKGKGLDDLPIGASGLDLAIGPPAPLGTPEDRNGLFRCSQCQTNFSSRDQLEKHELKFHPPVAQSCKICSKTFANVYRLQRHMISHDESTKLRKFKCEECEKAFKFKHHLKEHVRIHSGEKPFVCNNCGKRFSHSGSYSSHMTSKKCLVPNLKLSNQRNPCGNRNLDRIKQNARPLLNQPNRNLPLSPTKPLVNNFLNNNNTFPPFPKYPSETAPFLSNFSAASNAGGAPYPFYLSAGGLGFSFRPTPYGINLSHLFDTLTGSNLPPSLGDKPEFSIKEVKEEAMSDVEIKDEKAENEIDELEKSETPPDIDNQKLNGLKQILETVSHSVTKQFLAENMQKFPSTSCSSGTPSIASPRTEDHTESLSCRFCQKCFMDSIELQHHERYLCCSEDKKEGLAAKLEEAVSVKTEDNHENGLGSSSEDDLRDLSKDFITEDVDQDGKKIRVRSQIAEEQLVVLRNHYSINPRPKREELLKIAEKIGFPVRVVQVWFQNNRARDRKEGRLVQIPFVPLSYPVPTPMQPLSTCGSYSPNSSPILTEQPLDLSTKKSSPATSPHRPSSDSEDYGAMNLSLQSPPFHPYLDSRRSPSPIDGSKLARILAQPSVRFHSNGNPLGLVPMDRSIYSNSHLQSHSPLPAIAMHYNDFSKRSFPDMSDAPDDDSCRSASIPPDCEPEGQFTCKQCSKTFSKQSSLARHKYEHSGQRPYKCTLCTKAFKHKHHLTEHTRLHSGEKPYKCPKCHKKFSHSGSFSQHMSHRSAHCKPYRPSPPKLEAGNSKMMEVEFNH